jgi:hypothetical protein
MMSYISRANPMVHLRDEIERQQALFLARSIAIQRFIFSHVKGVADVIGNFHNEIPPE